MNTPRRGGLGRMNEDQSELLLGKFDYIYTICNIMYTMSQVLFVTLVVFK